MTEIRRAHHEAKARAAMYLSGGEYSEKSAAQVLLEVYGILSDIPDISQGSESDEAIRLLS